MRDDTRTLAAPLVGAGLFIALYLLLRPYGDAPGATTRAAAEAFASWRWVAAHVAGMLSIASFARRGPSPWPASRSRSRTTAPRRTRCT